ncbi:MAG: hypothetical protein WBD40_11140 [Tepidisphaeraceae bacterium]
MFPIARKSEPPRHQDHQAVALHFTPLFARATGLYDDWWITGVVYLLILVATVTALLGAWDAFTAMPVAAVATIFLVPILRNRTHGQLQAVALSIVGFILIGWMLGHLGWLTRSPRPYGPLLFVVRRRSATSAPTWAGNSSAAASSAARSARTKPGAARSRP